VADLKNPQLPSFVKHSQTSTLGTRSNADPYVQLLKNLGEELGFRNQETALRWLLEQLESSSDLRRLILVLLHEGYC
jgi:hypothetical protein